MQQHNVHIGISLILLWIWVQYGYGIARELFGIMLNNIVIVICYRNTRESGMSVMRDMVWVKRFCRTVTSTRVNMRTANATATAPTCEYNSVTASLLCK